MFDIKLGDYSDRVCLISKTDRLSYLDVDRASIELHSSLPKYKQLVIVKAQIDIETIIGYLTFLRADYAFMMLDSSLDDELLENIIQKYNPNFIWEERIINKEYIAKYKAYGLRYRHSKRLDLHPDLSLILSTSGTTGSPKMVKLTKANLYANCNSIVEYLHIDDTHRAITSLPLHYSYGISILNTHLAQGASIVVTDDSIMSKPFWDTFRQHSITTLSGVPYNYEMLNRIGFFNMSLPSLKYMTQAGGKLNHKLVDRFAKWANEHNIEFFVMYGQTEATARISYMPTDMTLIKSSSIGIPIPNGELLIQSLDSDKIIDKNYIDGELLCRGDNVMMGYATTLEELANGYELSGLLHTGDIAHKDSDGYYYITGRLKRFIKIYGNRVGLDEIEQYLKSKSYDILCTGVDNKLMIATLNKEDNETIKRDLIERFGLHHTSIQVISVDKFPVSSSGKIQYQKLIKEFV